MGTIVRSTIAYLFLLFLLRAIGRRSISQMTPFDLIVLFLLAGVSIQAVIGEDHSMVNAGLAAITLGGLHVAVASLKRWYPKLGEIIDGTPIVVFSNGRWYEDRMARLRLQEQDVMAAARENGLEQLSQIKYAVVERNAAFRSSRTRPEPCLPCLRQSDRRRRTRRRDQSIRRGADRAHL